MHFIIVNIGRNVDKYAVLAGVDWAQFRLRVTQACERAGTVVGQGGGRSTWDGAVEEFHTVHVEIETIARLEALKERLADLAAHYGQDAIGIAVGDLVPATPAPFETVGYLYVDPA